MEGHHHELISLLVLLVGLVAMPIVAGRIRVPSAITLIIFGFLVGPHGVGLLHADVIVRFLSEVGFMVLMFLAGLEIDFNAIREKGPRSLLLLVGICCLIFGLAFIVAWQLGLHPIFGLGLGATSVGLPLAVLSETGRLKTQLGQTVMLLGSVGEFITVIGMTLFYFTFHYGLSTDLVIGLGKLALVLIGMTLALRTMMALAWWHPLTFSRLAEQHDGAEIGVRSSLLLMMTFSLGALLAGVEAIVGAFIAGSVVSYVFRGKEVLEEKLSTVGHGLFVPIFFIVVGVRFDVDAVSQESLVISCALLVAAVAVKLFPSLLLLTQGLSLRSTLGAGLLLSAPLTLVVAIAEIGVDLHVLDPENEGALVVLAIASGIVFPVLFRVVVGRSDESR